MEPKIMNTVAMASTAAESKAPSDALRVEKPPVATVVMAWTAASSPDMPANR